MRLTCADAGEDEAGRKPFAGAAEQPLPGSCTAGRTGAGQAAGRSSHRRHPQERSSQEQRWSFGCQRLGAGIKPCEPTVRLNWKLQASARIGTFHRGLLGSNSTPMRLLEQRLDNTSHGNAI
jgi:hypothetical protein